MENVMYDVYPDYTKASKIVNLIMENPKWQRVIKDKKIRTSLDENGLMLFKYGINADFSDEIVKEARGIIIDMNTLEVVCWPFNKFFNINEQYAADIDWNNVKVQEKQDGALLKLFWNPYVNEWQWATNGTIDAKKAAYEGPIYENYFELIENADNYKQVDIGLLDKDYTYMFEIVDPYCHPVKYPSIHLYHIGTKNNKTGQEIICDIGIEKPKEYPVNNLNDTLKLVEQMNNDLKSIEHEGVVVVDNKFNRVKIKNFRYLQEHYLSNALYSKSKVLELLNTDDINIDELKNKFPQSKAILSHYEAEIKRIECELDEYIKYVRKLYDELKGDRKELAIRIKDDRYSFVGFKCLNNNKKAIDIIKEIPKYKYEELIDDYKGEFYE